MPWKNREVCPLTVAGYSMAAPVKSASSAFNVFHPCPPHPHPRPNYSASHGYPARRESAALVRPAYSVFPKLNTLFFSTTNRDEALTRLLSIIQLRLACLLFRLTCSYRPLHGDGQTQCRARKSSHRARARALGVEASSLSCSGSVGARE